MMDLMFENNKQRKSLTKYQTRQFKTERLWAQINK